MDITPATRHTAGRFGDITGPFHVHIRLEKINHHRKQKSYVTLSVTRTLFGEWCVVQESGQIDGSAGLRRCLYVADQEAALGALEHKKTRKQKEGYAVIPVQMGLF